MAVSAVLGSAVAQTSSLDHGQIENQGHLESSQHQSPVPPSFPRTADSSLSSSPRHYPTDLPHPILEEGDESECDSGPNEPVTPVSGRQSQDFHAHQSHDIAHPQHHPVANGVVPDTSAAAYTTIPATNGHTADTKPPIILSTAATPSPQPLSPAAAARAPPQTPIPSPVPTPTTAQGDNNLSRAVTNPINSGFASRDNSTPTLSRRSTRSSFTGVKRTMSSLFRRRDSQSDKGGFTEASQAMSDSNLNGSAQMPPTSRGGIPIRSSATTTQSNTPPSPGSPPLEMTISSKTLRQLPSAAGTVPSHDDFVSNKKKNRASTGFSLTKAIHFGSSHSSSNQRPPRQRANSFGTNNGLRPGSSHHRPSSQSEHHPHVGGPWAHLHPHDREPWALPPDTGTGVKARRMSLNLPDDFTIDVANLHDEFDSQHSGLRRKKIGKGATSKVMIMNRKGCPDELYAVKEFRGKSSSETQEEYDKKVKSEYSLAKSLHHPNIVETIRLCTNHSRWNHVMEYCSGGDLHSLVEKGYLRNAEREKDRFCLFKQLIQGINYLHTHGIAHRDIKLENLLITSNSKLKITDFGVSEVFSGIHPGLREAGGQCGMGIDSEVRLCSPGICGSMPFIAPEVLAKEAPYDPRKADVWSAAVVMLVLIFGGPLWHEARSSCKTNGPVWQQLSNGWNKWNAKHANDEDGGEVKEGDYPVVKIFDTFLKPPVLRRLLVQMLNPNPDRRLTIEKVAASRWVKGIECCQLDSYEDPAHLIDASKASCTKINGSKLFCHDHLPPKSQGHSLGKMPGQPGY